MAGIATIDGLPVADTTTGAENLVISQNGKTVRIPVSLIAVGGSVASKGAAIPSTDPGTPEQGWFYIATEEGTYANFKDSDDSAIQVESTDSIVILSYDGSAWTKQLVNISLTNYLQKSSLDSAPYGKNLFNKSTIISGKSINSNGNITTTPDYAISAVIAVNEGEDYTISGIDGDTSPSKYYRFSDSDDATLSYGSFGIVMPATKTLTAPEGATSLQFTCKNSDDTLTILDTIQVEKGDTATEYEAYSARVSRINDFIVPFLDIDVDDLAKRGEVYTKAQVDAIVPTIQKESKNLANPDNIISGLVSSVTDKGLSYSSSWKVLVLVPVTGGEDYTISGWDTSRTELAFYSGEIPDSIIIPAIGYDTNLITSGTALTLGITKAGGKATFTVPTSTTWMAITVMSNSEDSTSYEQLQIEKGDTATDYTPHGRGYVTAINNADIASKYIFQNGNQVSTDQIQLKQSDGSTEVAPIKLTLAPDDFIAKIDITLAGKTLRQQVNPYRPVDIDESSCFFITNTLYDGANVHTMVDEPAPYRVMGTTIGADHGYVKTTITANGHGKTNADVGSVWTDGTTQFVIVNIRTSNSLDVSSRSDNSGFTGTILSHISGATHTGDITSTANNNNAYHPCFKNHSIKVLVDGVEVNKDTAASYVGQKNVAFVESYDIMDKPSIMEWLITQVGTATKIKQLGGTPVITVSISYVYDTSGGCTVYSDFLALDNISSFQDIMFVMAEKLASDQLLYIPKSVQFTQDSITFNLSTPTDLSSHYPLANRVDISPSRAEDSGIFCDRAIMLTDAIGFALGYLPVKDAALAVRRTNASDKALQISESFKLYMACIDGLKSSLDKGDYFSAIAYRKYFIPESARTDQYIIEANGAYYLYLDWHETVSTDRIALPAHIAGLDYTLIEKSDNVSILTAATGSIVAAVDTSALSYGYAILKFML